MSTDTPSAPQDKWAFRFAFFDAHGAPNSPTYKEAFKKIRWQDRIKIATNFWAILFGPLYFLYLGLWKNAIVLYAASFALIFIAVIAGLPDGVLRGLGIGLQIAVATTVNYAYYLKAVKKQDGWNPFEGINWV